MLASASNSMYFNYGDLSYGYCSVVEDQALFYWIRDSSLPTNQQFWGYFRVTHPTTLLSHSLPGRIPESGRLWWTVKRSVIICDSFYQTSESSQLAKLCSANSLCCSFYACVRTSWLDSTCCFSCSRKSLISWWTYCDITQGSICGISGAGAGFWSRILKFLKRTFGGNLQPRSRFFSSRG